jgi:hypothetical protein
MFGNKLGADLLVFETGRHDENRYFHNTEKLNSEKHK